AGVFDRSTTVPATVVSGSGVTGRLTIGEVAVLAAPSTADALNASDVTPDGTVNRNPNGVELSVATVTPLTIRSTLPTGTRLAASTVIGIVDPSITAVPAVGDAIA